MVVAGATTISLIFEKSASGVKTAIALLVLAALSPAMFVLTASYLLGPGCVVCYQPRKLRLAVGHFIVVVVYGVLGAALVWWVGRVQAGA